MRVPFLVWERSPGGGHGNPLQYSCLQNPMDRGAWWAIVHGVTKESDMTEPLYARTLLLLFLCSGFLVGSQLLNQGLNLHSLHWKAKS